MDAVPVQVALGSGISLTRSWAALCSITGTGSAAPSNTRLDWSVCDVRRFKQTIRS